MMIRTIEKNKRPNLIMTHKEYEAYAKISNEDAFFEVKVGNWTMEEFEDWCTVQKMEAQSQASQE
jgi:hypothetical protein